MRLYLCIFTKDGEDEIGGFQVGHYSDFGCFRSTIARHMKAADFPVLMTHSGCDGEWTIEQLPALVEELETIATRFRTLPPEEPKEAFEHVAKYRIGAKSLYDCFHDVNGANLFESLIGLSKQGISSELPISFQ
ncbi:MAG: Imm70 family immunity protein [Verrucomicrobiota bacterium]